ncbi:uncharacterized protein LOC112589393 [Harpegnathos saltator]|uniref:uncharacterized protein LOC112589393 n=1 Tax=Harpegnathos saltator TaxID=610380 RepID=UPI000DBEF149|nr:uncharacterized protein LOC112589393 [Harpegnathos saltator]
MKRYGDVEDKNIESSFQKVSKLLEGSHNRQNVLHIMAESLHRKIIEVGSIEAQHGATLNKRATSRRPRHRWASTRRGECYKLQHPRSVSLSNATRNYNRAIDFARERKAKRGSRKEIDKS